MKDISLVDKNFKIETTIEKSDVIFYDVNTPPFGIHGVFYDGKLFRRMPESVARAVSEGVYALHANTAGGRIRFKTDSPYVAINARMSEIGKMSHFTLCGSAGFDLYCDGVYRGTFRPLYDILDGYESIIELGSSRMREVTINMPLYSNVRELYVGLSEGALIAPPTPYPIDTPVVFYGSSITQGGCASRPGTSYQSFISRELGCDFINLGFSGNAKGEDEMADYIKSLNMSIFVYDYDHNAPNTKHLLKTHERMFLKIREANPTLPIVMLSRPQRTLNSDGKERLEIIKATYDNAVLSNDKNVYFIDGRDLCELSGEDGTVDGTHPTDLGFYSMARKICEVLRPIISEARR